MLQVLVFNGSTLHGCSINTSGARRRGVHCAWVVRDKPQQTNQLEFLRPSTARRLTPLGRHLLDVGASEGNEQACRNYASFLSATTIAAPRL